MAESPRLLELKRRVQTDPASIAFAALAEEYRRTGELQEAISVARAGLARHPAYATARVTLGRALFATGHREEARQELEQALAAAPENLPAIRTLAELHRTSGAPALAREMAARGLALAPQDRELRALRDALGPPPAVVTPAATRAIPEPAAPATRPPVEAAPAPESPLSPALARLERWLDALVRERLRRDGLPAAERQPAHGD